MRILSVATTYPRWPGDSEPSFVHDLNAHLVARGHEVRALVPHAPESAKLEQRDGVTVSRFRYAPESLERLFYDGGALANLKTSWRARASLPAALAALWSAIRRELRRGFAELLHVHWLVPQGVLALRPAKAAAIPLLVSAHGSDVHQLASTPLRRALASVIKNARAVTANSADIAERVRQVATPNRLEVIPMGVDLGAFSPQRRDLELRRSRRIDGPWIVSIGRVVESKGLTDLLDATPLLLANHPQLRITIGGTGPHLPALQQRAVELGIERIVDFAGPLDRTTVAAYMASADLFVGASLAEGQGVVFVEAMACGCPVVATRVGGIPDVIIDGTHGRLVPPSNPSALAAAIDEALRRPELRTQWARAGLLRAAELTWPRIAERFERLYAELR
jgi:phosphatidyl-myo-inositol dimannoside synthase